MRNSARLYGALLALLASTAAGTTWAAITVVQQESVIVINTGDLVNSQPGDLILTDVDLIGLSFAADLTVDGGTRIFAGGLQDQADSFSGPFSTILNVTGAGSRIDLRRTTGSRGGMFTSGLWSILDGGILDAGDDSGCVAAPGGCGMIIGGTRDANSVLRVNGAGSQFISIDTLQVGLNADLLTFNGPGDVTATVLAEAGARILSENVILGAGVLDDPSAQLTATGTGTVTGAGSVWEAASFVLGAGERGRGELNVLAGGTVNVSGRIDMAANAVATGSMTIQGAGSRLTASVVNVSLVGDAGVLVDAGGVLDVTARLGIGQSNSEATGTVEVAGAGSQLLVRDDLIVGDSAGAGSGRLTVRNGASLQVGGADEAGFIGTFMVTGLRSGTGEFVLDAATAEIEALGTSVVSRFHVGDAGTGTASLLNGAALTVRNTRLSQLGDGLIIGRSDANDSGFGTVVVNASTLLVDSPFASVDLGEANTTFSGPGDGQGTLQILNGGLVRIQGSQAARLRLGRGAGATGSITVDNSRLDVLGGDVLVLVAHDLFGAQGNGTGTLQVLGGGVVNVTGASTTTTRMVIGSGSGNGALDIATGGSVDVNGALLISLPGTVNDTQTGTVTVAAGGLLETDTTVVGNRGSLTGAGTFRARQLRLQAGGLVDVDLSATDELVLDGAQFVRSDFSFGRTGGQRFSVTNGATLDLGTGNFGALPGTRADVSVSGATSRLQLAGDLLLGSAGNAASTLRLDAGAQGTVGGAVRVAGGSSLTVAGAASRLAATGNLELNGGSLVLEDQATVQAGTLSVVNGGLLGGSGTLTAGGVAVGTDGTLAPGNSPGTLNVNGNVTLAAGGRFLFEIGGTEPGQFDVLNVDGDIDLQGGTFELQLINGFTPGGSDSFDLLTATGATNISPGVVFTANGLGPDFEFAFRQVGNLSIGSLGFTAVDIQEVTGLSPNQTAMALYLDDICPRIEALANPNANQADLDLVCGNLRNGGNTPQQVADALDALMPDEILGIIDTLLRFTTIQHGNLSQRLNGLRNGAARVNVTGLDIVTDNLRIASADLQEMAGRLFGGGAGTDDFARWGFFSDGNFHYGDQSEGQHETGFDFDTVNLTMGVDYRLRDNLFLGVAGGYNEINADFDTGGGMLMKAGTLSLMGTWFKGESFYLDALATYGWAQADTSRLIQYVDKGGSVDRRATGSVDGSEFVATVGAGWDVSRGKWIFGPHGGANYSEVRLEQIEERGAAGVNLAMPEQVSRSMTANAGAHVSYTFTPSWGVLVPHARIDYVHEFHAAGQQENIRFLVDHFQFDQNNPTRPARLRTDAAEKDYWTWSVGAHAQFIRGFAAFVNYRGHAGLGNLDVAEVTVGIRYEKSF